MGSGRTPKRVGERRLTDWVIVDTDILIDIGRGDETAIAYLEAWRETRGWQSAP